jgi:hypothetical protein
MSNVALDKEQIEIIRATNQIKYNPKLSKKEKNMQYVDILFNYIEKHVPTGYRLIKPQSDYGLPQQFSLFIVKATPNNLTIKEIVTAIEVRGHGWVEKADDLIDAIDTKKKVYDEIASKYRIKCLYFTLEERRKVKDGHNYHHLSKQHLGNFFSLRDSSTENLNFREWENFVKALI